MTIAQWSVVRCAPSRTFDLLAGLQAFDLEAWTPKWRQRHRLPRSKRLVMIVRPMLPSLVFVEAGGYEALSGATSGRRAALPPHSFLIADGAHALIRDGELIPLREIEAELAQRAAMQGIDPDRRVLLAVGSTASIAYGPFAGQTCRIVGARGVYNTVEVFGVPGRLKVPPLFLRAVHIGSREVRPIASRYLQYSDGLLSRAAGT